MSGSSNASNVKVAALAAGVAFGMVGLAYASVPLYKLFCQVTGFGGTTQRAEAAPGVAGNREITVRFDANMASSLGWEFKPEQLQMKVKLGEEKMAFYSARNISQKTQTGSSIFNVTPPQAGAYFNKIQCFCFTEQTLQPGGRADFPVVFFVDPSIAEDKDLQTLDTITLSYTFYPVEKPAAQSLNAAPAGTATN